jgi:predicted Rossmann fold nucleotide-binding protein DprA/Smf involved in DNA uptake
VLTQRAADITDEFGWRTLSAQPPAPEGAASAALSGLPAELAALIRDRGEPLLDDLIVATGKSAPELLPALLTLELGGVIRALPSGRYSV